MTKTFTITLKITVIYEEEITYSNGALFTKSMAQTLAQIGRDKLTLDWARVYITVPDEPQLEEGSG